MNDDQGNINTLDVLALALIKMAPEYTQYVLNIQERIKPKKQKIDITDTLLKTQLLFASTVLVKIDKRVS